jgi:hypothetical protein
MRGGRPDQKVGLAALDVKLQDPFGVLGDQHRDEGDHAGHGRHVNVQGREFFLARRHRAYVDHRSRSASSKGCKQQFYVVHRMDSGKNAPLPHHSFG